MSELFKMYSEVRQPQFGLDPDLDNTAVLHFGLVVDYSKALEYAKLNDALSDPHTGRPIDWDDPPTQWLKAEYACMTCIVQFFSRQEKFIFTYAPVMGGTSWLHGISLFTNLQDSLGLSVKAQMRLLRAIAKAFGVTREEQVPLWWWDAEQCGTRYKSPIAKYNPMLPPPEPRKSRGRSRLVVEAAAEAK